MDDRSDPSSALSKSPYATACQSARDGRARGSFPPFRDVMSKVRHWWRGDDECPRASRLDAIPYDVKDVELGHHGKECSFEAILKKYKLTSDPALVLLGRIVNGADTDNTLYHQPEGSGLNEIAEGFRHLGYKDDHALNAAEWIVYDALYAYCQEMVRRGRQDGKHVIS